MTLRIVGTLAAASITATISATSFAQELSTEEAINALAVTLTEAGEKAFNKDGRFPSPQILFGIGGTYTYGSCQSSSGSTRIPGSFYCAKTNTIVLEYKQLESLRQRFGDGAVVYALAHEYAHYIQKVYGIDQNITRQELWADCIVGSILSSFSDILHLNQKDIYEIISTAAAIGGGTHGNQKQRTSAVMIGLKNGNLSACGAKKPSNPPKIESVPPQPVPRSKPTAN